jgi:hypothetical protein
MAAIAFSPHIRPSHLIALHVSFIRIHGILFQVDTIRHIRKNEYRSCVRVSQCIYAFIDVFIEIGSIGESD